MELTLGERAVRPLTADEVQRMVREGIIAEDEPVELLRGVLVEVSPKGPEHALVMARLLRWLRALPDAFDIRSEHPLLVPDSTSLPEPDVAVVERSDEPRHPSTALLVVEVSVSSRAIDTQVKPALYAAAGVPDYWVVDVERRTVELRREPGDDGYGRLDTLRPGDEAMAAAVQLPPLAVGDLLAGL